MDATSAVRAAHLVGGRMGVVAGGNVEPQSTLPIVQPSLFDVLSEESLMSGLKPAVGHLIKYLNGIHPKYFTMVQRYYDEIYLVFDLLLQGRFLSKYSSSFAENFYGMKRIERGSATSTTTPMTSRARFRSLLILSLVPYLRQKLDRLYEREKQKYERTGGRPTNATATIQQRLIRWFVTVYPYLISALELSSFLLQIMYVIGKSDVHSPWLLFANVKLANLTAADHASFDPVGAHSTPAATTLVGRLLNWLRRSPSLLLAAVSRLFGIGLFFLQFIDWWFSSTEHSAAISAAQSLPVPPPPQMQVRTMSAELLASSDPKMCPICRKRRTNDVVLSASGYVFCYGCILPYLRTNERCPVTKLPANETQLVRLFYNPMP